MDAGGRAERSARGRKLISGDRQRIVDANSCRRSLGDKLLRASIVTRNLSLTWRATTRSPTKSTLARRAFGWIYALAPTWWGSGALKHGRAKAAEGLITNATSKLLILLVKIHLVASVEIHWFDRSAQTDVARVRTAQPIIESVQYEKCVHRQELAGLWEELYCSN